MTKNKIEYFIKYSNYILILLFFFIFIFKTIQCFSTPNSIGDEGFYLNELNRFREIGLWKSFSEGISQLWILLAYLISLITGNDLISLRIINILLLPVALYLMYSIIKEFIEDKNLLILSMLSCVFLLIATKTGYMFFMGINDPLMIIFGLSTMYFLLKYNNSWVIKDLIIASLFAGMMFWVRSFSIIILGGFIAWIFLIVLLKRPFWKNLFRAIVFCILTIIIALIPQIPSLAEKGQLAFEHKGTENHNWGEINWLTRIKRESAGSLFAYKRPSWEELDEYKRTYGDKSIPIGLIEQFKYDPKFIIDNFIVNVFFRVPYILALSIGFLFLAFLNYLRLPEKWFIDKNLGGLLLLLTSISVCCGVSIYIINYVEHRWQFISDVSLPPLGADIFAVDRELVDIINERIHPINTSTLIEVLRLGFDPVYIPFERPKNIYCKSRWTFKKKYRLFKDTFYASSNFPIKLISWMGLLSFMLSIIVIIVSIILKLAGQETLGGFKIPGWTTTLIIISFFCGLILLSISIIAEYLLRVFDEVKNRPGFIIKKNKTSIPDK